MRQSTRWMAGSGLVVAVSVLAFGAASKTQSVDPQYTADGQLIRPAGVETWVFVGATLALSYRDDSPHNSLNNIYLAPEDYAAFKQSGEFPDGTILGMKVFSPETQDAAGIVNRGTYSGALEVVEFAVKDPKRPNATASPWAYYVFAPTGQASASPRPDMRCADCHRQHASKDNVWVQFYPTLRDP